MTYPTYEKGSVVIIDAAWVSAVTDLRLTIRVGATEIVKDFAEVVQDTPSSYHYNYVADTPGPVYYLWEALAPGLAPVEGAFLVDPNQATETGVTDPADLRTLIPRVRRALDGPTASSALAAAATLSDDEVLAAIADGVSDFLLFGGAAARGFTLSVAGRDAYYQSPTAWLVDPVLPDAVAGAVVAQVALNVFFHQVKALKVMERLGDEASNWEYQLSGALIRDQLKMLQAARDRAIEALTIAEAPLDTYVSYLQSRDQTAMLHIRQEWVGPPEF